MAYVHLSASMPCRISSSACLLCQQFQSGCASPHPAHLRDFVCIASSDTSNYPGCIGTLLEKKHLFTLLNGGTEYECCKSEIVIN